MNDAVCCFLCFRHYGELKDERCCLLFVCVSDIMENSKMNDAVCCFLCFRHYGELKAG